MVMLIGNEVNEKPANCAVLNLQKRMAKASRILVFFKYKIAASREAIQRLLNCTTGGSGLRRWACVSRIEDMKTSIYSIGSSI